VGGMAVMQTLLDESMRVHIYQEVCEWLHPIFQAHVCPIMLLAKPSAASDKSTPPPPPTSQSPGGVQVVAPHLPGPHTPHHTAGLRQGAHLQGSSTTPSLYVIGGVVMVLWTGHCCISE